MTDAEKDKLINLYKQYNIIMLEAIAEIFEGNDVTERQDEILCDMFKQLKLLNKEI